VVSELHVAAGQVIAPLRITGFSPTPGKFTIQSAVDQHLELDEPFRHLNHSCEPNCHIDLPRLRIVALQDIKPTDELTFFYPSTEWDMACGFTCWCGSARCVEQIRGARWLSDNHLVGRSLAVHIAELRRAAWQNPCDSTKAKQRSI
jgi:hypothetical protein